MTAGRYKHASDKLGKERQARAKAKRNEVRNGQRKRRHDQRNAQRLLRATP